MQLTPPQPHRAEPGAIATIDGVRFLVDDDPTRTVVARRPDGSLVRLTLGEFLQERRLAAQSLRRAEIQRCFASCVRRLKILCSTVKWRKRPMARTLAPLRSAP